MERTKSISIKNLRVYKAWIVLLFGAYGTLQMISWASSTGLIGAIGGFIVVAVAVYYWNPSLGKNIDQLKEIAYDSKNIYIIESGTEEQIPFHEIRDVEIVSLGGIYRFNFFDKNLHKGFVTCKTSMWYPLNFKKVDKELNRVRALIKKAHRKYMEHSTNNNQLVSFT